VLVTGGAGYIGAHTVKALAERGVTPIVFDNLSAGYREAVRWGEFIEGDVRDGAALTAAMRKHKVGAVIHLAALIEIERSVRRPKLFHEHNVGGTATLLGVMLDCGVRRLVFSSSAGIYGRVTGGGADGVVGEESLREPISPYGDTKLAGERMIAAACAASGLSAVALRYFNAAGADPDGQIGEAHDPESHLIPLAIAAGLGKGPPLTVFGSDYPTADGTCVRDYVHVADVADAHIAALGLDAAMGGFEVFNVGSGRGSSVLEVIAAVGRALGRPTPYQLGARRKGDPATLIADPAYASARLGWTARQSSLEAIVASAVAWRRAPKYGPHSGRPKGESGANVA
jgi:UDP-glucose 4-epimerase/UDP-arabinose 4-epimerase